MPRYEDGRRFWEGWLDGATLVTRQGSTSGEGRVTRKTLASPEKAARELQKRVSARVEMGYASVTPVFGEELPADHVAAILADPEDDGGYLVLADALQQQGHPRGELIMLQHAKAGGRPVTKLKRGEAELWSEHPELGLPPRFAEAARKPKRKDKASSGYCHAEWRCGYLRSATVGRNSNKPR